MLTVLNLNTSPNVGTFEIVGITAGAAIAVILGILLLICGIYIFKVSRKPPPTDTPPDGETDRLLGSHTPPQYGSSDGRLHSPDLVSLGAN